MNFLNLATGQTLNECDFYAHITGTDWSCCSTDDEVWLGNGKALTSTEWFVYFQTNTPSCPNQAPTCFPVVITSGDQPGDVLTVISWPVSGIPVPTKTYQWQESSDGGITWTPIGSGLNYTIIPANVGKIIRVQGTASNILGTSQCTSAIITVHPDYAPPSMITGPTISGTNTQGSILTCNPGTYSGFPNSFTYTYQWYSNGTPVGTNSATYELKIYDSLASMTCVVTISNGISPNLTLTSNTITAGNFAPQNTVAPVVSGPTTLSGTLTCTTGVWTGAGNTYSYQWYVNGNPVGNDSNQLQIQLGWSLAVIDCEVTATNPAGNNTQISNSVTAGDFSPVNTVAPFISVIGGGPANPGTTLQSTQGTWTGNGITYSYEWFSGMTSLGVGSTYPVTNANSGQTIVCVVTATNAGGVTQATSNSITIPSGPGVTPPSNTTAPTIIVASGGAPLAGKSLVANVGVWLGTSPINYTYEWFSGVTSVGVGLSYTMQVSDIGTAITCQVTGTNAYGTAMAISNIITPTGSVNTAPLNVVAPTIFVANGTPALAGKALTVDIGAWDGTSPITFDYQWFSGLTPVGTNQPWYLMQSSDIGQNLTCQVTATNPYGVSSATSNIVTCIGTIYVAPSNLTLPTILSCGSAVVGTCLSANIGTWDGDDITYSYEWYSGLAVVGTNANYQLQPSDFGLSITLKVTATNPYGLAVAVTSPVVCVDIPKNTVAPVISGLLPIGGVLTCTTGTWTGNAPITYSYQWLKNGLPIGGQITNTYTTVVGDESENISCQVIGTNAYGTGIDVISNVLVPTRAPFAIQIPVIYGSLSVGSVLTVQDGYYGGFPTPTITRVWQFSTDSGATWNNYSPSQTGSTYTIVSGDIGRLIRVVDTATNPINTASQTSNSVAPAASGVQRPEISVDPVVSGNDYIGQTLTTTNGTWLNSPTSYNYQWFRGTTPIGTNANTYTLVAADVNALITCQVTATNSGGNQPAVSNSLYAYDADFKAVVLFATAQSFVVPTIEQQQWLSQFVTALKNGNYWTLHDRLWVPANNGSLNFGRINWRNPTVGTLLTLSATPPTWSSNVGFAGNGTNAFIDTNFNPATQGVAYTLNNAGRYAYIPQRISATSNSPIDGNTAPNDNTMICAASNNQNKINQGSTIQTSAVPTQTIGLHAMVRTGANATFRAHDVIFPDTVASTFVASLNTLLLRTSGTYGTSPIAYYGIGGAISQANYPAFRLIIMRYMNNL